MTQRSERVDLDPPVGELDHVRGVEDAPVTLVEYGDYDYRTVDPGGRATLMFPEC
jgi:hypothetical protein